MVILKLPEAEQSCKNLIDFIGAVFIIIPPVYNPETTMFHDIFVRTTAPVAHLPRLYPLFYSIRT